MNEKHTISATDDDFEKYLKERIYTRILDVYRDFKKQRSTVITPALLTKGAAAMEGHGINPTIYYTHAQVEKMLSAQKTAAPALPINGMCTYWDEYAKRAGCKIRLVGLCGEALCELPKPQIEKIVHNHPRPEAVEESLEELAKRKGATIHGVVISMPGYECSNVLKPAAVRAALATMPDVRAHG